MAVVGCPNCGKPLDDTARHCPSPDCPWVVDNNCGAVIDWAHPSHYLPWSNA